jgi:hypothetical protein
LIAYALFAAIIALQQILHWLERRDLYNRLMSRDLTEYKRAAGGGTGTEARRTAHEKAIDKWRNGG